MNESAEKSMVERKVRKAVTMEVFVEEFVKEKESFCT